MALVNHQIIFTASFVLNLAFVPGIDYRKFVIHYLTFSLFSFGL